jgi:hypothetical protein
MHRRCAIYTRKSSEEGLEQNFNSLHAQRKACEAFIKSQASEGWQIFLPARRVYELVALARRLLVALLRRLLGTDCLREVKPKQTDGTPRARESLY